MMRQRPRVLQRSVTRSARAGRCVAVAVAAVYDQRHHLQTAKPMKTACVHIVANRPRDLPCTGVMGDLHRRMHEHRNGVAEGFSKKYNTTTRTSCRGSHPCRALKARLFWRERSRTAGDIGERIWSSERARDGTIWRQRVFDVEWPCILGDAAHPQTAAPAQQGPAPRRAGTG